MGNEQDKMVLSRVAGNQQGTSQRSPQGYSGQKSATAGRAEPFQGFASGPKPGRTTFDGSREQFMVGNSTKVSELLAALPMELASPALISAITAASTTPQQSVAIRLLSAAPTVPGFYDQTTNPTVLASTLSNNAQQPPIARLGLSFTTLRADVSAAAPNTSMAADDWRAQAAAVGVLARLDKSLAQGDGTEAPVPGFLGLAKLCSAGVYNRTAATSTDIEKDARNVIAQICPNGLGVGQGPDCLIGGPKVMRKLMSTASGQRGLSGWKRDERTGRLAYHYMGLPYYRTETDESATGKLYAANFGPTGLCLVHTLGTRDTFGLTVDVFTNPGSLLDQTVVHGAYALVAWEPAAIYEITGIDISSL